MTTATRWTSEAVPSESLRREIVRRVTPLLAGAGITARATQCRLVPAGTRLEVHFVLPTSVSPAVEQALAVCVLDAVRGIEVTYGPVHVTVRPAAPV